MSAIGSISIIMDFDDMETLGGDSCSTTTQRASQSQPQCRQQSQARHHHYGNHAHRVPVHTIPSTQRYSTCPRAMISVQEALRIISSHIASPIAIDKPVSASIIGSVIAEDVHAATMVPTLRCSAADSYAVVVEEGSPVKGVFPGTSVINAGIDVGSKPLQLGRIANVTSGAPIPSNANAVVDFEDTALDRSGKQSVQSLNEHTLVGQNVQKPGSHIPLGYQIVACGESLSAASGAVGLLAMAGIHTVKVFEKPRVGILSVSDGDVKHRNQIQRVSYLAISSCLTSWGFDAVDLGVTHSTPDGNLEHHLGVSTDVVVIINHTPKAELDLNSTVGCLGGAVHFRGVSMKPGSQTSFATIPVNAKSTSKGRNSKLLFLLSCDSKSALVGLNLLVLPSLQKLSGSGETSRAAAAESSITQLGLPRVAVVLTHHFPLDAMHTEYHLAVVTGSRSDARLYATSISVGTVDGRGSHVSSSIHPNAMVILQAGRGVGIKGEIVEALLMGPIRGSDTRLIC